MSVIKRAIHLGHFLYAEKFTQYFPNNILKVRNYNNFRRNFASSTNEMQPSEKMQHLLQKRFPKAKKIEVNDLSGGCGSMYEIFVETVEFKGLPLVKQHMLINETLKDQIKNMHGLTVKTKIPDIESS